MPGLHYPVWEAETVGHSGGSQGAVQGELGLLAIHLLWVFLREAGRFQGGRPCLCPGASRPGRVIAAMPSVRNAPGK